MSILSHILLLLQGFRVVIFLGENTSSGRFILYQDGMDGNGLDWIGLNNVVYTTPPLPPPVAMSEFF